MLELVNFVNTFIGFAAKLLGFTTSSLSFMYLLTARDNDIDHDFYEFKWI